MSAGYEFRVLPEFDEQQIAAIASAVGAAGRWEFFVELRMAAGPTVSVEPSPESHGGHVTTVTWGSQRACAVLDSIEGALAAADRLAFAFYEMRDDGSCSES